MKHLFVIILLGISFNISLWAQTSVYFPFPNSNAFWREYSGGYQCGCCSDYQNFINGDTTIGGHIYKKIYQSGVTYMENMSGFCTSIVSSYFSNLFVGGYRNDSINKKVYGIRYPNYMSDTLLYNFNLNLYDTVPISLLYDPISGISYISEIDSVLVGNLYHKRFAVSSEFGIINYVYLIEGIGSTHGLFGDLQVPFEFGTTLMCFIQNGQTVFPDTNYQCNLITNIGNEISNEKFNIFPNPCNDHLIISCTTLKPDLSISIVDQLGRQQLKYCLNSKNQVIDLHILQPGIYYINILNKSGTTLRTKFLKLQ